MTLVQVMTELAQLRDKQSLTSWDKQKIVMYIKFICNTKCMRQVS